MYQGAEVATGASIVTTSLFDGEKKLPVMVQRLKRLVKVVEMIPTLTRIADDRLIIVEDVRIAPPRLESVDPHSSHLHGGAHGCGRSRHTALRGRAHHC